VQGKYKDNVLVVDVKNESRRLFKMRLSKLRDRANCALVQAQKAAETAAFKADVAAARFHNGFVTSVSQSINQSILFYSAPKS